MRTRLQQLNNILLDIIMIQTHISRNPRAEITGMKTQLKAALNSMPAYAEQVDNIRTLNALYQFADHIKDELKIAIKIEKGK